MVKRISLSIVLLFALILALIPACGGGDDDEGGIEVSKPSEAISAEKQQISVAAELVCDLTSARVGEEIAVAGRLGVIDRNDPNGIYADLDEDRCHVGIWITKEQWNSWAQEAQSFLQTGTQVVAKGKLNSFEGNLILELNSPLSMATENVSENTTENVLAAVAERLNLVSVPDAEKRLNVVKVYSGGEGPGLCYLGTYAMLAKYADNSIDFSDVITNSGIATSAYYIPEINLLLNGFEIGAIAVAAQNQGFSYYISALEGATLTDPFMARNLVENAEGIISVSDGKEAFTLLKRLISSGIPIGVHLDINYIRDDLITYCPYWENIFSWQDRNMGSTHIDHYMSVNGYDQEFVYLNDPTEKEEGLGQDIPIRIGSFLDAWENGNHPSFGEESRIGPYWMLFLGDRTDPVSTDELLSWNKDIAVKAISEIREAAVNPNVSDLIHCNGMFRSRAEFAKYLAENGYEEASGYFTQMSDLFAGLAWSLDQKADMLQIADLQEQALVELSTETGNASVTVESVCDMTSGRVGEEMTVAGRIGMVDWDNPEGIYAMFSGGLCWAGMWIPKELWESWNQQEQAFLEYGKRVVAKGKLTSFQADLILELNSPLTEAEDVSGTSDTISIPNTEDIIGESSSEQLSPREGDLGEGDGSDVLTLGDSQMECGIVEGLNLAAGKTYVDRVAGGSPMLGDTGTIPSQYEAVRELGKFKTVIMDGGGDFYAAGLITADCLSEPQCLESIFELALAIEAKFRELFEQMSADGVMDVIYLTYSSDIAGGLIGELMDAIGFNAFFYTLSESVMLPLRLHIFDTTEYVMGDFMADGLHYTDEASHRIAQGVYELMVAEGMRR